MKKSLYFSWLILAGIFLVVLGFLWPKKESDFYNRLKALPDGSKIRIKLDNQEYQVEVVNSATSIQKGLSERQVMGSEGMLFVLPAKSYYSFWMPKMYFDLDILWFDDQNLVEVMTNVPKEPWDKPAYLLPLYLNQKKANLVLEVPSGFALEKNISPEKQIKISD